MGLLNKLLGELVDIIEWVDTDAETIIWKFPRYNDEIKNGAKLTVRESQVAVFMNQGVIADVYKPGMYTLTTENMPILSTLRGWKHGFASPFKADVYFVSTRQFTNQKWGTKNPVMMRDAEFGPVRLRAFGSYAFRVADAATFIKEVSATNPDFTVALINEQLRNIAVSRGMDVVASSGIPILDLTMRYDELSGLVMQKTSPDYSAMGLTLTQFLIENISLPPEVEAALDKRTSMGIVGNLGAYAQFQAANAMEKAAENPNGGLAGAGLGLGMGAGMMGQVANMFQQPQPMPQGPPPLPASAQYFVALNGQQNGPHTLAAIQQMIQNGTVNHHTQVWKAGMAAWGTANTLPELASILGQTPPPLVP